MYPADIARVRTSAPGAAMIRPATAALLLLALASVSHAAPALQRPPIPRTLLFGNSPRHLPEISPDGPQISWLAPDEHGVENVWARPLAADSAKPVTHEDHRPIEWYRWAADSKHVLYLHDSDGDERNHLYSADLESGTVRDLTPFRGVRAQNVLVSLEQPNDVLVGLNLRDPRVFDMHRIALTTGAVTLEAKNPGDVLTWTTDWNFVIRAATAFDPKTGNTLIRVRDAVDQPWRDVVTMPFEQAIFFGEVVGGSLIAAFGPDNRSLVIHSALGSDHGRLVRVDGTTGQPIEVLASHPAADVADDYVYVPEVIVDGATRKVAAVAFDPGEPVWRFLDAGYAADFAQIARVAPGHAQITSCDAGNRKWVLRVVRSDAPDRYLTYDRDTHTATPLFSARPDLAALTLAPKQVVSIPARDGLRLPSYLTLPAGVPAKHLPLLLLVHGGPWFRDSATFDPEVQFLADRG